MRQLTIKTVLEGGGNVSRNMISKFEQKYEIKLPNNFIEFILMYDGTKIVEHMFTYDGNEKLFNSIFAFSSEKNNYIEQAYLVTLSDDEGLGRNDLIPFADGAGGVYYFSIGNNDTGSVYFEGNWTGNLQKMADSFEEFINGLHLEKNIQ